MQLIGMPATSSASQAFIAKLKNNGNGSDVQKTEDTFPAEKMSGDEISFPEKLRPNEKYFFDLPGEIRNTIYGIWFTRKAGVLSLRVSRAPCETNYWAPSDPKLNWHLRGDGLPVSMPLEMSVLRVCKLMNAEANATLFGGETTIDLRDPVGAASIDRLHQYIRDPVCTRPLQLARRVMLSLYPELSVDSGRKHFAATLDAVIKVLDGGSRLKSLEIVIHVSDHPTKKQVEDSIMRLQGFCVNGSVTIRQFVYGNSYENWVPGVWDRQLLQMMQGKEGLMLNGITLLTR
jgi:hypothetical protein